MDSCDTRFLLGWPIFRGCASFREGIPFVFFPVRTKTRESSYNNKNVCGWELNYWATHKQTRILSMNNCLFNRDPYNGLLYSLQKWVTHAYSKQSCFCYCSCGYEYRGSMPSTPGLAFVKCISCCKAVSNILLAYLQVRIAKDRFLFVFEDPQTPKKTNHTFQGLHFFKGPHPNHLLVPWLRDILRWHSGNYTHRTPEKNPAKTVSLLGSAGHFCASRRFSRWTWYHEG